MGSPYSVVVVIRFAFIHQRLFTIGKMGLHWIYYFSDNHYHFQDKGIAERVAQRNWQ